MFDTDSDVPYDIEPTATEKPKASTADSAAEAAKKTAEAEKREKLVDYDHTRVATKFPHIAEQFFNKHGMQMEYIKLNGSIELGPIVGLSESIVDIVETGTTLRENDLEEIAYILDATARLIVNRVSFKLKFDRISQLTEELRKILERG